VCLLVVECSVPVRVSSYGARCSLKFNQINPFKDYYIVEDLIK
jgi:hypothetical protein